MALIEFVITLAVIATTGTISYSTLNPDDARDNTQVVADTATCHTLTGAAVGYYADNDVPASTITDITPYVSAPAGVLARYTVVHGVVSGPGCP